MDSITYQCPNCNGALEFDNASGRFVCKFCDSTFSDYAIRNIFKTRDESVNLDENEPPLTEQQMADEEFTGQSALYTCPNCGAGVICDSLTASTRCHFCHTPVILSGRLSGDFKPNLIIPFATTKEQAEENFRIYTKGKLLLPNGFIKNARIYSVSPLYVPYWLKSGSTDVHLTAIGKQTHSWTSGNRHYTHTKEYQVERRADMAFVRVPCDGSRRIDDSLMESIEPFDYTGIKLFSMSYLSGCAAEKYDVDKMEAAKRIDQRIREAADAEIRRMADVYTSLDNASVNVTYTDRQYVYALMPVWFLNYNYKGKDYAFVMNGQTGTTFGELPVSKFKKFLLSAGIFLITFIIVFLLGGACLQ